MNFAVIDAKTDKLEVFTKSHGMTKAEWIKELRRAARLVGKKTKVKIPTSVFDDVEQNEENLVSVRGYMRAVSAGCMRHDYQIYKNSHSGRRTFITKGAKKITSVGGSLRDIQYLAGHTSLATTQKYIEGDTEAQRKLIDLM